jgi:hypothetical protein
MRPCMLSNVTSKKTLVPLYSRQREMYEVEEIGNKYRNKRSYIRKIAVAERNIERAVPKSV